ncbi:MAG: HU family DNA-binding protein [Syntrophomonadaceae bacterium]|nr:HU family DNA-binding protein [Syntrophomonadaceae bacterium]
MRKINQSELIETIATEGNYIPIEVKELQDIFTSILLKNLRAGNEVIIPGLGKFYAQKSRKPSSDGLFRVISKFRASPTSKKFVSQI